MEPIQPAVSLTPALSDGDVVARVGAGEIELFELLMRRHNQRLFRAARAILRDDAEAEDVLQEAWMRIYGALRDFQGRASFSTWALRITIHAAFARLRRGRRFVSLEGREEEPSAGPQLVASTDPGPEEQASTGELRDALAAAVDALPEGQRAVFVLREVEGLSTAETVEALGLSEENVKVRLHRAKAALRQDLDRRLGRELRSLWGFAGDRCDRTVAAVMARLRNAARPL